MMIKNNLRDFEYAAYDAIMGIGPLATANIPGEGQEHPRPSIMQQMKASVVSICLGQSGGSNGALTCRSDCGGMMLSHLIPSRRIPSTLLLPRAS